MTRWSALGLAGLGTYGVAMLATGLGLAVTSGADPSAASAQLVDPGVVSSNAASTAESTSGPVRTLTPDPLVAPGASGPSISVDPAKVPSARAGTLGPGQVASFIPLELVLPNGNSAPIQAADTAADGSLLIPENPRVVGYWSGGAKPGEPFGSLVIAGHVDSAKYGVGVLFGLKGVKNDEVIEVRNGKQHQRYRVTGTKTVAQQSLATDNRTIFDQTTPARLIVITCGGPFDPVKHRYQDNVIITAVPTA